MNISALEPRPYQQVNIDRHAASYAAGHNAPLYVLPTAGGKTVVFSYLVLGANRKRRGTFVAVHWRELICQAAAKLTWAGVTFGVPAQKLGLPGVRTRAGDYVASDLAVMVDQAVITGGAAEQYRACADHQPAIGFCAMVAHAEPVAAEFGDAGYRAAYVHGATPIVGRDALIAGLGNGCIKVLTSEYARAREYPLWLVIHRLREQQSRAAAT